MNHEETPVPGQTHPALLQYRDAVLQHGIDQFYVEIPVPKRLSYVPGDLSPSVPTSDLYTKLCFNKRLCGQSLAPEYGTWLWWTWTDQYGRHIVSDAEWKPTAYADYLQPWGTCESYDEPVVAPKDKRYVVSRAEMFSIVFIVWVVGLVCGIVWSWWIGAW